MHGGNLYHPIKELLDAGGLAELGPNRRATAWSIDRLDKSLTVAFQDIRLTPALKDLLRTGVYLWHDHLDEAHRIAQEIETPEGSLWHAIMHRREPDYGNSKYWFRRVGAHPSFLALAIEVGELLEKRNES
ncbi:MAG TPA: hypothetical protein VGR78_17660, partial [Verrucomicrobiae bacterium]|nr:hypothetical protein [Verrucomicrobiae bacterium]